MPIPTTASDTPTRAARSNRPHTRAWKQLITDASKKTSAAAAQRARLRAHLAAADRLAAKRAALIAAHSSKQVSASENPPLKDSSSVNVAVTAALPPKSAPSSQKTAPTDLHPVEVQAQQNSMQPLFEPATDWAERVSAFVKFTQTPSAQLAPAVALVLPSNLRDLRSKVVVASADATVAAAPFLTADERKDVFTAASAGTSVTKKVMADSSHRAALAVLSNCVEPSVWEHVLSTLSDNHVTSRQLVVLAVTQLVNTAPSTAFSFVSSVVTDTLRTAATDKELQVRDAARDLVSRFRERFGDEQTQPLLMELPIEVRSRFSAVLPSKTIYEKKGSEGKINPSKRKPTNNIRDMIKARRDALKKCRPNDNIINNTEAHLKGAPSSEKAASSENPKALIGEENTEPKLISTLE